MRIIQANKYYFLRGGAERAFFELTKLLERGGHMVAPFAMQDPRNLPTPYAKHFVSPVQTAGATDPWQALRTAGRMLWSFEAARKFRDLAAETKAELLHAHNIYHQLSPSILAEAKKLGIPSVMTLHDYHLISPNYVMFDRGRIAEPSAAHPYLDTLMKRSIGGSFAASALSAFEGWLHAALGVYGSVSRFIVPSAFLKAKCVAHGVDAGRIEVIPHFIDLRGREPSFQSEGSVIFVGRLSEEKGAQVLIEAMKSLPDTRAVIVGDGPQRAALHRQADGMANIVFTGELHGEALKREMDKAAAVIVPSVCYEVFGLTALEAYAAGKPVIASRIGGLPEVVRDGETGLLFEAGNTAELAAKIRTLAETPDLARKMGMAGRALAESEYTPEKHLERTLAVYRQVKGK